MNNRQTTSSGMRRVSVLFGCFLCVCASLTAHAELKLASVPFSTYVDQQNGANRLNHLVAEALRRSEIEASLSVMRPAFLGSGLSNESLDGDFAFITLDNTKDSFVYSSPYLPLYLVAASKRPFVKDVRTLAHLQDSRIAIENRFVNTDQLRLEKMIKWSRNPDTYDAFRQLADGRSRALITSSLLVNEFNLLLTESGEAPLFTSPNPLVTAQFRLAIRANVANADSILRKFNSAIQQMQSDGTYNRLLQLTWLLKDIDNDGDAEYIGSTAMLSNSSVVPQPQDAYSLDNTPPATTPSFIIDGAPITSWDEVMSRVTSNAMDPRKSLLDEAIYERMMRRW
ncbi:substrate-binding periplasmic protein [Alteromonas ponticola]|uniref:ABC transporter substrate-binding protein n=1 Tax=Alteromonas ponticola TaxID=2720613 RepID=A0ABX1R3C3_9ALTE|nr:ABC transporter substrate-binding protein [Alteromonas ponticola]NMH60151.1 ABC transporter substrate-binding protein [Alteromonas ponticola]